MKKYILFIIIGIFYTCMMAQEQNVILSKQTAVALDSSYPYLNPNLPLEQRMDDLITRMTLEEKVSQMNNVAKAIPRLGIPEYNWWNECLHGVLAPNVTVFPQAIGLGASFNKDLVWQVANATSDEARALYHEALRHGKTHPGLTYWSPNINIFRDPRWGRGQETYGEDPYLTSRLGVSFVEGLQGNDSTYFKVISTPKHFAVHSGPDPLRHTMNTKVDEKNLYETYLPHFEAVVKEAHAQSIMCAYNRLNGEPCCSNTKLQEDILRGKWRFDGYIVSDCGAIDDIYRGHKTVETREEAAARALNNGCDLCCGDTYDALVTAVHKKLTTEENINRALKRLLRARFKLGMFDPDEKVPYAKIPITIVDSAEHRALALQSARESMVLLKNDRNILPLNKNLKTIAVIGPNADAVDVLYGNYNGTNPHPVTPLEGISRKVFPNTKVIYAKGSGVTDKEILVPIPAGALRCQTADGEKEGLRGEYFNNMEFKVQPALDTVDRVIDFNWTDGSPNIKIQPDNFTVRWSGKIIPPVTGEYELGTITDDGARLYLDGKLVVDDWKDHGPVTNTIHIQFQAGQPHDIVMEYYENKGEAVARLVWAIPHLEDQMKNEALQAAKEADVTIMVLGITPRQENEENDRKSIDLPQVQQELLESIVALKKPVVLVLLSGSALAINWADQHIPAILQAWYPGEEGGTAIADILFGDYNPAGRLPVTYYQSLNQVPPFTDYDMAIGRTYKYFIGKPLYPFGFGLSYTKFRYSNLSITPQKLDKNQNITVSVKVKNAGKKAGDEVVQLYISHPGLKPESFLIPNKELKGFQRVSLQPGEERKLDFTVTPEMFSIINNLGEQVVEPGELQISVGGGQPGFESMHGQNITSILSSKIQIMKGRNSGKLWNSVSN